MGVYICEGCGKQVKRFFAMNWIPPCLECGGQFVLSDKEPTFSINVPESRIRADVDRGIKELEEMLAKEAEKGQT